MHLPRVMIACACGLATGALACTTAPSGASSGAGASSGLVDGVVVLYGVGHRDGEASLDVYADGRVIAREQRHDALAERRVRLEPTEIDALHRTFAEHRCCRLRSRRKEGVPDEARPSLAIRWAGEDCKVQMWDGEWSDDPHAEACLRAVEDLHRRAMKSPVSDGEPPSP